MNNWTEKHIKALKAQRKIRDYHFHKKAKKDSTKNRKNPPICKTQSKEKDWMAWNIMYWCNQHALEFKTEFKFDEFRRWKFDWCIPALKIGIEYEGLMSEKSRHTTAKGFTGDTEKYNQAQQLGWKVLRFTALNYKDLISELNKNLCNLPT